MQYESLTKCLCCGAGNLTRYLDLGNQPLANAYHNGQKELPRYPLGIQVCDRCFHSQLTHKVDNRLMFDDYLYVSGTSATLTRYFQGLVQYVITNWKGKKPPRVLEIACNDGTLLEMFKDRGCEVVGVDPAVNLAKMCGDKGLHVLAKYWDHHTAQHLLFAGKFDVVIAVNVLPHVPDPKKFVEACGMILDPAAVKKGGGIYIQTSQCDMFKNGEFDAIYHEHHSYFTVSSLGTLSYETGMDIKEMLKVPIHSKSLLFKLVPHDGEGACDDFYKLLAEENEWGWHTLKRYKDWGGSALSARDAFKDLLKAHPPKKRLLVGYGASAKANTVLNFFDLSLDYMVDDSEMKWGLLTPGRNIPIISPDSSLLKGNQVMWVMTAWNFKEEIIKKLHAVTMRGIYSWPELVLSYIPEVKVEVLHELRR